LAFPPPLSTPPSLSLFSCGYGDPRDLPSFPTRRSSDLRAISMLLQAIQKRLDWRVFCRDIDRPAFCLEAGGIGLVIGQQHGDLQDRKSTRLNSSHVKISYAVFCLKKKTRATSSPRWRRG